MLVFELHEGKLLKRLKIPGPAIATVRSRNGGERNTRNRFTSMVWRGQVDGIYSGHTDGQIRAWIPRTKDDEVADREEEESSRSRDVDDEELPRRKRQALDDVFRDLTRQKITFG